LTQRRPITYAYLVLSLGRPILWGYIVIDWWLGGATVIGRWT